MQEQTKKNIGFAAAVLAASVAFWAIAVNYFIKPTESKPEKGAWYVQITRDSYDAKGNLIKSVEDPDDNGIPNSSIEWIHDSKGRRVKTIYTRAGKVYRTETDEYNPDGTKLISSTFNKRNKLESVVTKTFDKKRRELSRAVDFDADGTIDEVTKFTYGKIGHLAVREVTDYDGDGRVDSIITRKYNASGKLIETKKKFREDLEKVNLGKRLEHGLF